MGQDTQGQPDHVPAETLRAERAVDALMGKSPCAACSREKNDR